MDETNARRSESLNRSDRTERRASVTKVVMVKDKRAGSLSNCSCEQIDSSKRYSITKVLPVRSKLSSQDEITINASDYHARSRSSDEGFFRKKTSISEIQAMVNRGQHQELDSSRKFSVTKVIPVRGTDQLTIDLDQSLINVDHNEFIQNFEEHRQHTQHQQQQQQIEISEHTCFHGGVTSNKRDFELLQRKSSVDMVAPQYLNVKFLQLRKLQNASNEAKYLQLKKVENETQEEYLLRMEKLMNEQNDMEEMNIEESYQTETQTTSFQQSSQHTVTKTVQEDTDLKDLQREIDACKDAIDTIDQCEETMSKQDTSEMSAEEIYQQRRDERKFKKHVSFDLVPDVVHEYGESAETTEVEEMTDEDYNQSNEVSILHQGTQEDSKEEYYEISKWSFNE